MALLAADDPSYAALLERADCTLAELQDQWFRFLESDNQHRRVDEWRTWWQDAGVPLPDQRSDVSRTYLMTWNPGREKDSPDHPPPEALQDIATHGSAILPWRISNLHNVFVGERVFLHRQGHEPKGLVGAGRIAGPVEVIATSKSKAPGHQVPVRWTQLFTEPIVLLKSLEDTGDKISEWKAQKSGNVLSAINAQVAEAFWKLAEVARSSPDASTAFHKNVVQIRFNAWHYIETNLWASLVDQILTGLDSWLRKEASGQGGKVIEDVFGRLETPRRLLLESVSELVGAREQEQTAKQDLETANQNLVAARKDLEAAGGLSASDALRAVLDSDEGARKKIAEAAESLGIPDLEASGRQLSELVEQAREDGNRLRLISGSIARRLGQPLWLLAAILLLVLAPLGMSILGELGDDGPIMTRIDLLLAACRSGIAQLAAAFAAAGVWLGAATGVARKAIDKLQKYDRALEKKLEEKLTEFKVDVGAQAANVDEKAAVAERAREGFDSASAAVQRAAEQHEVNARERLFRFIRGKVASGEYAKELSLVSTLRKDFEQLTDMMVAAKPSKTREVDREEDRRQWEAQLGELDLDGLTQKGLLKPEERKQLERNPWHDADSTAPHFERVVLYVDDLDRCPPEKVVDVLQAIHLLLYFPLFVVIVAVDSRWVSNALIDRYPGLLGYQGEGQGHASPTEDGSRDAASPRDYLEKIFQVPYWVRPVEETASRHMVKSLVGGWPQDDATPPPLPAAPGGSGAAGDDKPADPVGGGDDEEKTVEVGWIDPNPRSLELTVPEKKFLSQMAPYVNPSPRTLRRFVIVYRVLRSGLKENDLHQVTRESGDPALHRALIAQLAMVSGAPHLCEQYFVALRNLAQEADPVTQLATDFKNEWGSRGPSEEVEAIAGALRALVQSGNDSWAMIELLRDHADTVKRYSFGGEPLINARSGSVPPEPRSP